MLESTKIAEKERFTALTSSLELGDQKPSELLHHLEKLAEGRILGEAFLRELFLRNLPGMARTLLVTQPDTTPLRELVKVVVSILGTLQDQAMVAGVRTQGQAARDSPAARSPPVHASTTSSE